MIKLIWHSKQIKEEEKKEGKEQQNGRNEEKNVQKVRVCPSVNLDLSSLP